MLMDQSSIVVSGFDRSVHLQVDQDYHGQEPLPNPNAEASWDAGFWKGESKHRAKAARSTTSASQLVRKRGLETVIGVIFRANRRDEESWII